MGTILGGLTVTDAFAELLRRIELNETRVTLASQRYQAIKKTLEAKLPGMVVKQIGSFQRRTKIKPQDLSDALDLDAIITFKSFTAYAPEGQGTTPASALQTVKTALVSDDTYRIMKPQNDSPVVVLQYADDFKIELVPAYIDMTGQHDHGTLGIDCYIVPEPGGRHWQVADYDYDAAVISATNQRADVAGMLIPFIKIAKSYLRTANVPLKSFHTEVLATLIVSKSIATWSNQKLTWGYQHLLADFLSSAPALLVGSTLLTMGSPMPVSLPGSFSPAIDSGLDNNEISKLVAFLKERSEIAWKICALKDETQAVTAWRNFIGDPFPAAYPRL